MAAVLVSDGLALHRGRGCCTGWHSTVGMVNGLAADLNWKLQISNNQRHLDWGLSSVTNHHQFQVHYHWHQFMY